MCVYACVRVCVCTPTRRAVQISILNGASLFGRTIPNFLADVWGPFNGASLTPFRSRC